MHRLHVNPFSLHLHSSQRLPIRTTCSLAMWTRASQRPLICRNSSILTPTLRPCWCSKRALKSPLTLYRSVTAAESYYSLLSIHCTFVHKKVNSLFFIYGYVCSLQAKGMKKQIIDEFMSNNRFLLVPRLVNQKLFDELCPVKQFHRRRK